MASGFFDHFPGTGINASIWNQNQGTVQVSGSMVRLPMDGGVNVISNNGGFTFADNWVVFKLVLPTTMITGSRYSWFVEHPTAAASGRAAFERRHVGSDEILRMTHIGPSAGTTNTDITWNPAWQWFRLREDGNSGGTIYWDVSVDGTTWSTERSTTTDVAWAASTDLDVTLATFGTADSPAADGLCDFVASSTRYLLGGSQTSPTVSTEGQGEKIALGGSEGPLSVSVDGEGFKIGTGGEQSNVDVSTTGDGQKSVSGGSDTTVQVSTTGNGRKTVSGGSEANVLLTAFGKGLKRGTGGSASTIVITTTGGGEPGLPRGGSIARLHVIATGGGFKLSEQRPPQQHIETSTTTYREAYKTVANNTASTTHGYPNKTVSTNYRNKR